MKLVLMVAAFLMTLMVVGCEPAGKAVPVSIGYEDFTPQKSLSREAVATRRDTITVTLPSNPGTGFKWELTGISDTAVLAKEGDPEYMMPETELPGGWVNEVWTFRPLERGTTTINMAYSQPWEGGIKKDRTVAVEVKIR